MSLDEIITSIQERYKLIIVLVNNQGFASIGGLSRSLGTTGFGTRYLYRSEKDGQLGGDELNPKDAQERYLPVDLAKNAESLGAIVMRANDVKALEDSLRKAKKTDRTTLIYVETDRYQGIDGYAWWEVPVAEVSENEKVQEALKKYEKSCEAQRHYLKPPF